MPANVFARTGETIMPDKCRNEYCFGELIKQSDTEAICGLCGEVHELFFYNKSTQSMWLKKSGDEKTKQLLINKYQSKGDNSNE